MHAAQVCGSNATTMNILSTIFTDRHAGTAVESRIPTIITMAISATSRFTCGLLIAAAPLRPRPLWLVCGAALAAVGGQLLLAMGSNDILFPGCVALGISDGMFWGS